MYVFPRIRLPKGAVEAAKEVCKKDDESRYLSQGPGQALDQLARLQKEHIRANSLARIAYDP